MTRPALAMCCTLAFLATCHTEEESPSAACRGYLESFGAYFARCRLGQGIPDEFVNYCTALLSAPGSSPSAAQLSACGAKVRDLPCDRQSNEIAECAALDNSPGSLADGRPCVLGSQCASGHCQGGAVTETETACGKCEPAPAIGADCLDASTVSRCARGATCSYRTSKCVPQTIVKEGASCDVSGDQQTKCEPGLTCGASPPVCQKVVRLGGPCTRAYGECGGNTACVGGTCQLRGLAGAPCASDLACADLACNEQEGKCVAVTLLAEGQACAPSSTDTRCAGGLYCSSPNAPAPEPRTGVCKAFKAKGAACDPAVDRCTPLTFCRNGTCASADFSTCK